MGYHARAMANMNWGTEPARLEQRYSGMADAELEKVARDSRGLTAVALDALRAEMLQRGLAAPSGETGPGGEPSSHEPRLVTLERYRDMPLAFVAKSILDSAGIESFLADENVLRMDWLYSNGLGGIKLLVREEDAETARAMLEQKAPEKFDVDGIGEYEQPKCPKCGSLDISFEELDRKTAHVGLLVGLPVPATVRGWKCHACGNIWEHEAGREVEEGSTESS